MCFKDNTKNVEITINSRTTNNIAGKGRKIAVQIGCTLHIALSINDAILLQYLYFRIKNETHC